jgi:hypothetical protein
LHVGFALFTVQHHVVGVLVDSPLRLVCEIANDAWPFSLWRLGAPAIRVNNFRVDTPAIAIVDTRIDATTIAIINVRTDATAIAIVNVRIDATATAILRSIAIVNTRTDARIDATAIAIINIRIDDRHRVGRRCKA